MATYAAVVSVIHLMEQIQSYQARNPIFDDSQQSQLESLGEKVSFLQDFLETYSYRDSDEAESLESRIVDAAYAAEDLIESYIVDDIHRRKTKIQSEKNETNLNLGRSTIPATLISNKFSQDVQNVIDSIDSIKREILEIKDKSSVPNDPRHPKEPEQATASSGLLNIEKDSVVGFDDIYPHHRNEPEQAAGSLGLLNIEKDTVVGFDDIFNSIMKKLTEKKTNLQVITITGMGGSGKSTLAKKVYDHPFVKQHFDVCGWVTVSQEFNVKEVLLGLLRDTGGPTNQTGNKYFEYIPLEHQLHKHLSGRRFFIVIDDIWSVELWDMIKRLLPDNNIGSRIVITTRLLYLAYNIGSSPIYKMKLLDETQSWSLLCRKVFGKESCPLELEEVGKLIVKKCEGLPLSIVVIGGLLRKSIKREYWEYIAKDISARVNSEDNELCLKILYRSYNHLPIHLKPCFLYLGVFPEGHEIRVTELIMLWVAERFLKPNKAKSLEEVAIEYLKDLIDRNLIFVTKLGSIGSVKRCKVHDLLRDLCLREATKKKFLHVSKTLKPKTSQELNSHRRLVVCGEIPGSLLSSSPFLRSFICYYNTSLHSFDVKLLSVLNYVDYIPNDIYELVNSRYLKLYTYDRQFSRLGYLLWNVQTLILGCNGISFPSEIWEMSQLQHIIIKEFTLDDPCVGKSDGEYNIVLENLQTLKSICDFRCSEEVLRKIPNIKKLSIVYGEIMFPSEYLKNLSRLTRLGSLKCDCVKNFGLSALEFSLSLKKLDLRVHGWDWNDIGKKVGLLPHLEKFTLFYKYGGEEWNLVNGQFRRLKYLEMSSRKLIHWTVDGDDCFPWLERLRLRDMKNLEEIPSEIGDILTLRSIKLSVFCSDSAIDSAKMIRDEQMMMGNDDLLVKLCRY